MSGADVQDAAVIEAMSEVQCEMERKRRKNKQKQGKEGKRNKTQGKERKKQKNKERKRGLNGVTPETAPKLVFFSMQNVMRNRNEIEAPNKNQC